MFWIEFWWNIFFLIQPLPKQTSDIATQLNSKFKAILIDMTTTFFFVASAMGSLNSVGIGNKIQSTVPVSTNDIVCECKNIFPKRKIDIIHKTTIWNREWKEKKSTIESILYGFWFLEPTTE